MSAPGRDRTCDLRFRKPLLYPLSYGGETWAAAYALALGSRMGVWSRSMVGIISYGVYLPYWRLQRGAITAALGSGGGKGTRAVASYDEDTTSMGVEAARIALANAPAGAQPGVLAFATTAPAYLDKTNATTIHAALALPSSVGAMDTIGSVRSGAIAPRTGS